MVSFSSHARRNYEFEAHNKAGPESSGLCGRKTPAALGRRCRRAFFPPTLELEDPGLRITKDAPDRGPRAKPREAIRIRKSS